MKTTMKRGKNKPVAEQLADNEWVDRTLRRWAATGQLASVSPDAPDDHKAFEERCRKEGLQALDGVRLAREAERVGLQINSFSGYVRQLAGRVETRIKRPVNLDAVLGAHGVRNLDRLHEASPEGLACLGRLLNLPADLFVLAMVRWDLLNANPGLAARCRSAGRVEDGWVLCRQELDRLEAASPRRAGVRSFLRELMKACERSKAVM